MTVRLYVSVLFVISLAVLITGGALILGFGGKAETKPLEDKGQALTDADKAVKKESNKTLAKDANKPVDKDANNDQEPVGKDPKGKGDLKLLQGSWTCQLRTIGEKELFPSQGKKTLEIKGDTYGEGTLILDVAAKPKRLDVKLNAGDDKGKTMKGIYEFRDGQFVWCFNNAPDGPRPTSFDPEQHAKEKHAESIEICIFKRGADE